MSPRLYWLHEDALRAEHPVLQEARSEDTLCFVWDDAHLEAMGYSFQRLVFIFETLAELGVTIFRGKTDEVLLRQAQQLGTNSLQVPDTPNPALQDIIAALRSELHVEVIADKPFVILKRPPDLRRFFRYWKSARGQLMDSTGRSG